MAENEKKGSRSFEPGTLDHTRRNIGQIDPFEAQHMANVLGGEIIPERSVPVDPSTLPRRKNTVVSSSIKATGKSSADIAGDSAKLTATSPNAKPSAPVSQLLESSKKHKTDEDLPALTNRDWKLMDKLMISSEYAIKPNYGIFNFFFKLNAKNKEKISKDFAEYTIKKHIEHMQKFIENVKTFILISPDTYKARIANDPALKFKFLRTVGKWTMRDIKLLAVDVQAKPDNMTVSMLIPFVKAVYRELITIYYIGESQISTIVKEIYQDLLTYAETDKKKAQIIAKEVITEWLYVYNQIIKGMYPLLMRMCSSEYVEFPRFFTAQISEILAFLNITKFDLLLPEKKKKSQEQIKAEREEAIKKAEEQANIPGRKDEIVNAGLKILEQLFPEAGFSHLERHPDMYPYFQPLYKFSDGFNMLSPENGLQVTVVLLRILEDIFQGLRNAKFNIESDEKLSQFNDTLSSALNDWTAYREELFEKKYGDYLRTFVNQTYSQHDYPKSQFGKEALTNMLWYTKYFFLPYFEFQQILLKKPANDSKYRPLFSRTDYLRKVFTVLGRRIDENAASKKTVLGMVNPWDRYEFDIPNVVSKRLDVLLGAKKQTDSAATNANLVKYSLCIVAVLDWWINNAASPAYACDAMNIYRISEEDGAPEFSAPERNDQNQLFAAAVKRAVAARTK
jgi:hypothetical protein